MHIFLEIQITAKIKIIPFQKWYHYSNYCILHIQF